MTVRLATEADIPAMLAMGRRLFARAGWPDWVACDDASMSATMRMMIDSPTAAVFVHQHGFAGANICPAYFNHNITVGNKVWWWAEPGYLRIAHDLFAAMESWARERGAGVFLTSASSSMAGAERLYRRSGYASANKTFMKRIAS